MIVLVTPNYPPQALSGTAITMQNLAGRLERAGHVVRVLVAGPVGVATHGLSEAIGYGHDTPEAVRASVDRLAPHVIIGTGRKTPELLAGLGRPGRRVVLYMQDAATTLGGMLGNVDQSVFASDFLRQASAQRSGGSGPVIPPLVEPDAYSAVSTTRRNVVAFGLARIKRADLTGRIAAALPDIGFDIFHTWGRRYDMRNIGLLFRRNVHVRKPVAAPQSIFGDARVVLVPSDSEGWCRVVTEAQLAGIPAVARSVGALPESVGPGGILLPADASVGDWAAAIRRLYDDIPFYRDLSDAARAAAARPLVDPGNIAAKWEAVIRGELT